MALTYASQKCDCCGGSLEYQEARKVWVCLYCGNDMVRKESYDGQFSIKWVARQALLSVANRQMEEAAANVTECSKIDPHYVGTTIASLAYSVISLSTTTDAEKSRALASKAASLYSALKQTPLTPLSDEDNFYAGLDSSDAYGLLALVYDTLQDDAREQHVVSLLKAGEVYSPFVARDISGYSLSENNLSIMDDLIRSSAELDCAVVLPQLLLKYPDSEMKIVNVQAVVPRISDREKAVLQIDEYLSTTGDSLATRLAITKACLDARVSPNAGVAVSSLLPCCTTEEEVRGVVEMTCSSKLHDDDVAAIVSFCATGCSGKFGLVGLEVLAGSQQFVTVSQADILRVLARADLALEERVALVERLYAFNESERFRQGVLSVYLREGDAGADRLGLLGCLLAAVSDINPVMVEDYLTNNSKDGAQKPAVVGVLLAKSANHSLLKRALSHYLASPPDAAAVASAVVGAFVAGGVLPDESDLVAYAGRCAEPHEAVALIRAAKTAGWQPSSRCLDSYLVSCGQGARFSTELFSELNGSGAAVSAEALAAYALCCVEPGAEKPARLRALAACTGSALGVQKCRVKHLGRTVDCTLLQAYVLASPDPDNVARAIMDDMARAAGALDAAVCVGDASGPASVKFKKYLGDNRSSLGSAATGFCETQKLLTRLS